MGQLTVRYFAAAAEAAGRDEEVWNLGPGTDLDSLRAALGERYGDAMRRVMRSGSFLVDGTVQRDGAAPLGTTVDVLPPFAGG
ncbi:MoaD/ThiS family protein [Leucobacter rhizosphaerae]|uniref:MoaD/ThiS family protein n=1 Tax=Leucobacter rhizosphaerae TaxID=2932245 RepID=A0ABY4FVV7_9MICO|nr:MoaD/ThiS family protein [Leucobacter rhizosphaerae]UOQ60417.1 MoaD/ThiS family protein [Leucobacter rhizosphaerae]